jgi:hypothetical protein
MNRIVYLVPFLMKGTRRNQGYPDPISSLPHICSFTVTQRKRPSRLADPAKKHIGRQDKNPVNPVNPV